MCLGLKDCIFSIVISRDLQIYVAERKKEIDRIFCYFKKGLSKSIMQLFNLEVTWQNVDSPFKALLKAVYIRRLRMLMLVMKVDSPIVILQQDEAKELLKIESPHQLYRKSIRINSLLLKSVLIDRFISWLFDWLDD